MNPEPVEADDGGLYDEMNAAAHGLLGLALSESVDGGALTERETSLVNTALAAGVSGALEVLRRRGVVDP